MYSKLAILTLGAKVVSVAITLVIAILYRTYWSLVLGLLAGALASLILSYVLRPYRPRFSWARAADIFGFRFSVGKGLVFNPQVTKFLMVGFDHEKVAELVNLPADHCIGPLIAVGKKTKDSWPKPGQLPLEELVLENSF